ncbi:hypothetical protein BS47DRAFT_1151013 [Hydnum rufescens UP504]|uniref:Uncharacterized protein n=1 Tax=Hydnum rufescens UP504 TaxID=1448309 RepID=A0A9P6B915_9AGAM|nr:hypothetical protein BS47DRAFT_1151013 [Hydnum rufescens UP504]
MRSQASIHNPKSAQPRFHVSIVMAIIVGKIWSNTLMHGLNSRRGLRAIFYAPQTSTDLETIEFAQRRQRRNSPVRDHEVSMEFADMGGSGGGSVISTVGLEQDLSSMRVSPDGEDDGEVEDGRESFAWQDMRMRNVMLTFCHPPDAIYVRLGEQPNTARGGDRQGGAHPPQHE